MHLLNNRLFHDFVCGIPCPHDSLDLVPQELVVFQLSLVQLILNFLVRLLRGRQLGLGRVKIVCRIFGLALRLLYDVSNLTISLNFLLFKLLGAGD